MAARKGFGALVFGGGSGLGLATGKRLVKNGYKVVLADLPSSEGDRVARDLGDSCIFAPADVSGTTEWKSGTSLGRSLAPPPPPPLSPACKDEIFRRGGCVSTFDLWDIFEGNAKKIHFWHGRGCDLVEQVPKEI